MNSVDPIHGALPINYRPQPKKIRQEGDGGHPHHPQHDDSVELSNSLEEDQSEKTPEKSLAPLDLYGEEVHHLDIAV